MMLDMIAAALLEMIEDRFRRSATSLAYGRVVGKRGEDCKLHQDLRADSTTVSFSHERSITNLFLASRLAK